jgi:hypothetical protein
LRELPTTPVTPTTQEQLAVVPHQHDADVGAKSLAVDVVAHVSPGPDTPDFSTLTVSAKQLTAPPCA